MPLQLAVLLLERMHPKGARDDQLQDLRFDGLLAKIRSAEADCFDGVALITVAGDDDDLHLRRGLQDLLQCLQAFRYARRIGRQPQVLQHHRRLKPAQLRERLGARGGYPHPIFVKAPLELLLQTQVILHDQ